MATGIRLAYVLSHGHSGSTLLGMLLAGHPEIFNIGEAAQTGLLPAVSCGCRVRPFSNCALWQEIEREMVKEHSIDFASLRLDHPDRDAFAKHNLAFLRATSRVTGASLLVDTSKKRDRLIGLLSLESLDISILALRRDPRGVVYSNVRKERGTIRSSRRYARTLIGNSVFLRDKDPLSLSYEALAAEPEIQVERLFADLGLSPPAEQTDLGGLSGHSIGGNRMRYGGIGEIRDEEIWRHELRWLDRLMIKGITAPSIGLSKLLLRSRTTTRDGSARD